MAYRVYGLSVDSTLPLPCPRVSLTRRTADVRLRSRTASHFVRARECADISPAPAAWFECRALPAGNRYLRWAGLVECLVSADAHHIDYRLIGRASSETLITYVLGQVLSFALLSRGCEPLHATAIVIDGGAVAFLGDCGYGKSTLGAALVARGFPMLTDDLLALDRRDGAWVAHAGPARLKVFPSIARAVLASDTGPRLNPGTSKVVLRLDASQTSEDAVPVKALYVLPDPATAQRRTRISITPMAGQPAFVALIAAAFNLIQTDPARLKNQFAMATDVVKQVPVRKLSYPRRLSALGAVCDAIVADVSRQSRRAPRALALNNARTGRADLPGKEIAVESR